MVHDEAFRIEAAHARTRINALVVQAGPRFRTIRAQHTLGPALVVRITEVVLQTATGTGIVAHVTLGVHAARRRIARIHNFRFALYW